MSAGVIKLAEIGATGFQMKSWMRLAALLYANGKPIADIAQEFSSINIARDEIAKFLTSPEGRDLIKSIIGEDNTRLAELIRASAIDSVLALVRIRDFGKSETAQVSASCQLLDRCSGRVKTQEPPELIKKRTNSQDLTGMQAQIERLQAEISGGI